MNATEYAAKWPKYCRTCKGIGGTKFDPGKFPTACKDCYGKGKCGRCAGDMQQYIMECLKCGWTAYNAADALPGEKFV